MSAPGGMEEFVVGPGGAGGAACSHEAGDAALRRIAHERARQVVWRGPGVEGGTTSANDLVRLAAELVAHADKCPTRQYWEDVLRWGSGVTAAEIIATGEVAARFLHDGTLPPVSPTAEQG